MLFICLKNMRGQQHEIGEKVVGLIATGFLLAACGGTKEAAEKVDSGNLATEQKSVLVHLHQSQHWIQHKQQIKIPLQWHNIYLKACIGLMMIVPRCQL